MAMPDQAALNRVFAQYARTIVGRYDIGDLLYQLTDHVLSVLDVSGAGVCLADTDGQLQFVAASDQFVVTVEQSQVQASEGPCHDAYRSGQPVIVADLNRVDCWPVYTPVAIKVGCQAVIGLPMRVDERCIGALNVYSDQPREWSDEDIQAAQLLADMASGYIINLRQFEQARQLAAQLQTALDSRVVIERAVGILAERHHLGIAEAFEVLRGYARRNNRKLHEVAGAVIEGTVRL